MRARRRRTSSIPIALALLISFQAASPAWAWVRLSDDYQKKNTPIVRQRMYRAGVRLANVLNECFAE
jgi:S1/P1 Nuclease